MCSGVYTVNDEGFEKDGAVVGFTSEFVDHACSSDTARQPIS